MNLYGSYNGLCFHGQASLLQEVCDRAHRKAPVPFVEHPLEDLLGTRSRDDPYYMVSMPPRLGASAADDEDLQVEQTCTPFGFGRAFTYAARASTEGPVEASLTLKLPEHARYRVSWPAVRRDGATFELPSGIEVRVATDLPWSFEDGTLVACTGATPGVIALHFTSSVPTSAVQRTVIIAAPGFERDAVIAQAALGPGFVPALMWDPGTDPDRTLLLALSERIPHDRVISLGIPGMASSPSPELGTSRVIAPARDCWYGPALYIAITHGAALTFGESQGTVIVLRDASDREVSRWDAGNLLEAPMYPPGVDPDQAVDELVICENTFTNS